MSNTNRPKRNKSPLQQFLDAGNISRVDLAYHSKANMNTIKRLTSADWVNVQLDTLCRIALALGCAPAELIPELARRPRTGLLYDRGVFKKPK